MDSTFGHWKHLLRDRGIAGTEPDTAERRRAEYAGQQCADGAVYAVDAEYVEGVVLAQRTLQYRGDEEANEAGHRTDDDRAHRSDGPRRRGDGDEPEAIARG